MAAPSAAISLARPQTLAGLVAAACLAAASPLQAAHAASLPDLVIEGDAIAMPLADAPGDPSRGRAIIVSRQLGLCLLCHSGPFQEERSQGTLAPSLAGAGGRWTEGQLRLRVADARRLNPATVMPSYYRIDGLVRVGTAWQGRPVLTGPQIEDVVAFLRSLRD